MSTLIKHIFNTIASPAYRQGVKLVNMASLEPGVADIDSCILLVDKGADLTVTDVTGNTALHWAAYWGHEDLAEVLTSKGFRDVQNNKLKTPLHHAAGRKDMSTRTLQSLINGGAKLDVKDHAGDTPLMIAAFYCNVEKVNILLKEGADPTEKNHAYQQASHIAQAAGQASLAARLKEAEENWGGLQADYKGIAEDENLKKINAAAHQGSAEKQESAPIPEMKKKSFPLGQGGGK